MSNQDLDLSTYSFKNLFATWRKQKGFNPITIVDEEGSYLYTNDNKKLLDFSSQLMCSNLGHKNKRVISAMIDQLNKVAYVSPSFNTPIKQEIANELKSVLPKNLVKYFFATSGTEANEAAIKIIRMIKGKEGKTKILSYYNSYHGSTSGSIQLTGDFRRIAVDSYERSPGFYHIPPPYCYRCPFNLKYPECDLACVKYAEYVFKNEGNVGGVFVEPVIGTNGVIVPPKEYLRELKKITEENDAIFVADEVMSGWGRTGEWFAVNHFGIEPDILNTAKGITGAYFPLSLTAVNKEISDYFEENYFAHGHTYEAHPLGLAAAVAAIREYKERRLIENSKALGIELGKRLEEFKERHKSIGDVRYIGLFAAIELVKNREKKTPFNTYKDKIEGKSLVVDKVAKYALDKGVYVNSWVSHLIIAPPLIITKEELNQGLDVIDEALNVSDKEVD